MKVDAEIAVASPGEAAELGAKAEEYGFDCLWVNETKHDPFVQIALAAGSTRKIQLGTSIALAFTRSPTTLAYTAWDLQSLSKGRFTLGLGSQVKGHIERRFGMRWEPPAPKMKDVVLALRSVWGSWQTGTRLDYNGRFFRLDLMTPFFTPGPIEHPAIPVYIAAVNEGMCRVGGMIADGIHVAPEVVKVFLQAKGIERAVLITDAISATGMPDGRYQLGPIQVDVKDGKCTSGGSLAGSVLTMDRAVRNVTKFSHWNLREAVRSATLNPARAVQLAGERGVLATGAVADFVVLSPAGEVLKTVVGGRGY